MVEVSEAVGLHRLVIPRACRREIMFARWLRIAGQGAVSGAVLGRSGGPFFVAGKQQKQTPPRHLRAATKRWWKRQLSSPPTSWTSTTCGCWPWPAAPWDRAEQAREVLDRQGVTYNDRFGQPRTRPEVAIERRRAAR